MVGCDNLPVSGLWTEGAPPGVVCAHGEPGSLRQVLAEPGVRVLLRLARAGLCPGTPPVLTVEAGDD